MGLFGFDPLKEAGGWEAAMTEEEIAEMEKKGYDMSSVRGKQAEIAAQEEADGAAFAEQRKATAGSHGFKQAHALPLHAPQYGKRLFPGRGRKSAFIWQRQMAWEIRQRPIDLRCGDTGQQCSMAPRYRRVPSRSFCVLPWTALIL